MPNLIIQKVFYSVVMVVVVICHDQVRSQVSQGSCRRGSSTLESIPPASAIDPPVASQSGVRCKRTSVSRLVVKLHRQYRCRLVRRTLNAYSPVVDD